MGSLSLRPYQASSIQALRICLAGGVEVWRDCVGYEGLSEVSNLGSVRSLDRINSTGRVLRGKILSQCLAGYSYRFVTLCNGSRKQSYVHRIVALAFLGAEKAGQCINHINGDKEDNRVANLEWATYSENMVHSTHVLGNPLPPAKHGRSEIVSVVGTHLKTGEVVQFSSQSEAGRNGFHQQQISDCLFGRQKTHRGFRWEAV